MNCGPAKANERSCHGERAFTLAEVLAAMLFMAIVIPVAMQGIRIAALAGEVASRKGHAARIAERMLSETLISSNGFTSQLTGTVTEGATEYRYVVSTEPWMQHLTNVNPAGASMPMGLMPAQPVVDQMALSHIAMNLLTIEVFYTARGQEYSVKLSTLLDANQ